MICVFGMAALLPTAYWLGAGAQRGPAHKVDRITDAQRSGDKPIICFKIVFTHTHEVAFATTPSKRSPQEWKADPIGRRHLR
jgi:hypothetical protein